MSDKREIERKDIWKQYRDFYPISGGIILVIIGIWLGSILFSEGYETNLYTEAMGVLVTILVLDRINQWRDRQALKKRLIREAGSRSNEVAISAIEWLRAEDWLVGKNSLLKEAHLWSAKLDNANLNDANLEGVYLREASLVSVSFRKANLANTQFRRANLSDAQMGDADLRGADLHNSNLTDAVLLRANLENARLTFVQFDNANLKDANLKNADLMGAIFTETTVLPSANVTGRDNDGKLIFDAHWSPDTDMSRYTDPHHPEFWQATWLKNTYPSKRSIL